jgi:hypothetical protein
MYSEYTMNIRGITEPPSVEALVPVHSIFVFALHRKRFLLIDEPIYLRFAPSELLPFTPYVFLQTKQPFQALLGSVMSAPMASRGSLQGDTFL